MPAGKRTLRQLAPALLLAYGTPVALSVETVEDSELRWVHIATEGNYAGYAGGKRPFQLTAQTFETVLANFHAHPQYADGKRAVVPYDYEHASEKGLAVPGVAQDGVPACGWIYELEIREKDGKTQLWALSEFIGKAAGYVDSKEYKWTSIGMNPEQINPITAANQGPTLTSVALTNKPFLQGLAPIAASLEQWGKAETPLEIAVGLREIFRLPTEGDPDPKAIMEQIELLQSMWDSGAFPSFLDVEHIIGRIRDLLGLPVLTDPKEILSAAVQAVGGMVSNGGGSEMTQADSTQSGVTQMTLTPQQIAKLALLLKCTTPDRAESLLLAAEETAKVATEATDALAKLKEIFGSDDTGALLKDATAITADAAKLGPMIEQLTKLREAMQGVAKQDAENDAEMVAASMAAGNEKAKKGIKAGILALRENALQFDDQGQFTGVDETILASFREDYAEHMVARSVESRTLTTSIVAGPGGAQLGSPATRAGAAPAPGQAPLTLSAGAQQQPTNIQTEATMAAINAQPGRNEIERTNAYLCSLDGNHSNLPRHEQLRISGQFVRDLGAQAS